jgi:urate oxidase
MSGYLKDNSHGKERVRVAKVHRGPDGVHRFVELSVRVELRGGVDKSFTDGDNTMVIATDTCKNHVYMLAKTHDCANPESFARDLSVVMLDTYDHLTSATIAVTEKPWDRKTMPDGTEHSHGFIKKHTGTRIAKAVATRAESDSPTTVEIMSMLEGYATH